MVAVLHGISGKTTRPINKGAAMPHNKITIIETILFAIFAGAGGMLSYLLKSISRNEQPKVTRATIEAMSSAFVGLIAMLACKAMDIDVYWSGVIVGVFGWIGAETSMLVFTRIAKNKLGVGNNNSCKKP